jgi:hypothetical protein
LRFHKSRCARGVHRAARFLWTGFLPIQSPVGRLWTMAFATFPTCTTDVNSGRLRRKMANTETQFLCTSLLDLLALAWCLLPSVSFLVLRGLFTWIQATSRMEFYVTVRGIHIFSSCRCLSSFFNNMRDAKRALAGSFLIQGLQKVPSGFDIPNPVNRIEV